MKKLIIIANIFLFTAAVNAQQVQPIFTNNPFPKTITVSGSAEMEIVPDEIYVNITLREYQKRGEDKKDIETIKTTFLENCKAIGLPDSVISIISFTGYNNYYSFKKRKKDPDMQSSITYQVKFKSSELMDKLVEKLDDEATQNFVIASTSHSKMTEFRRQLKIKAVQAAKDKGIYLTEAVSERLGEAITIIEPDESNNNLNFGNGFRSNNSYSQTNLSFSGRSRNETETEQEIDFKKIKLRYEVSVVFALK
jgi:uncharacterized protein YggE